jgi:hypothetical protein
VKYSRIGLQQVSKSKQYKRLWFFSHEKQQLMIMVIQLMKPCDFIHYTRVMSSGFLCEKNHIHSSFFYLSFKYHQKQLIMASLFLRVLIKQVLVIITSSGLLQHSWQ